MLSVYRILSIGDDDTLRYSRDLILRKQGYEVESISSNALLSSPPAGRIDVAVIGQSVSPSRARRVAAALRQANPDVRILRIQSLRSQSESGYDLSFENLAGPRAFLNAVKSLCGRKMTDAEA